MSHSIGHDDTPRDPELLQLYREAARGEPPAALDRVILEAARQELERKAPRPGGTWWRGWLAPVSLVATVVLTVTVTFLVHEERRREEVKALSAPADSPMPAAPSKAPAAVPESQRAAPAMSAGPLSAPAAAPQVPSTGQAAPFAEDAARAPSPAQDERVAPADKAKPALGPPATQAPAERGILEDPPRALRGSTHPEKLPEVSKKEAAAPASAPAADSRPSREIEAMELKKAAPAASIPRPAASDSMERPDLRLRQAPAVRSNAESESSVGASEKPAVTTPEPVPGRGSAARSPEAWLDEIRALKRQGREDEARDALAQFRRVYPGYPVPQDLR